MNPKPIRPPKIEVSSNNYNIDLVEGHSATNITSSAKHGYQGGVEAMAERFRELIYNNDMKGLYELAKATETKSFYSQIQTQN